MRVLDQVPLADSMLGVSPNLRKLTFLGRDPQ